MAAGKDYFTDKCPFTTLEQLNKVEDFVKQNKQKYLVYYSERLHVRKRPIPNVGLKRCHNPSLQQKPFQMKSAKNSLAKSASEKCQTLTLALVEVVSRILGHAKVSITLDVYRHVLDSEKEQMMPDLFDAPLPVRQVQPRAIN
jgi:integrase